MMSWPQGKASINCVIGGIVAAFSLFIPATVYADICPNAGDLNNDGVVNVTDLGTLLPHWQQSVSACYGDINKSGTVDITDLAILLSNWNKTYTKAVPTYNVIYERPSSTTNALMQQEYFDLSTNPLVQPSYRSTAYNQNGTANSQTAGWEQTGYDYYYTVASSDFGATDLYETVENAQAQLANAHDLGLYMHEVVSGTVVYKNLIVNGSWEWGQAASDLDWTTINGFVQTAQAAGKKVVWSEPAEGWQAIEANPTFQSYMNGTSGSPAWGSTLVPTFATNFPFNITDARSGASSTANTYHLALGESVQSWYWYDAYINNPPPACFSSADTRTLMDYGLNVGATYFQIEGTPPDVTPGSIYMTGINDYANALGQGTSTTPGTTTAPPSLSLRATSCPAGYTNQ